MALTINQSKIIPFNLPGVDGKNYSHDAFKDAKILVIIFSCNHCPYVIAWEDRMIKLQKEYEGDVQFILINANDPSRYPEDSFENMKKRSYEKMYPFPYLFDETQEIAKKYGAERTPEVFLFDREGVLRYHGAIDDNYESEQDVHEHYLKNAIDNVLSDKSPVTKETSPVGCTIKWRM